MAEESGDRRALALCEHALSLNVNANDWTDLGGGARIGHWQRSFYLLLSVHRQMRLWPTALFLPSAEHPAESTRHAPLRQLFS
jgi:hypothetical protein